VCDWLIQGLRVVRAEFSRWPGPAKSLDRSYMLHDSLVEYISIPRLRSTITRPTPTLFLRLLTARVCETKGVHGYIANHHFIHPTTEYLLVLSFMYINHMSVFLLFDLLFGRNMTLKAGT